MTTLSLISSIHRSCVQGLMVSNAGYSPGAGPRPKNSTLVKGSSGIL
jgi:hypothetical protein